jgi:hypothetical protein
MAHYFPVISVHCPFLMPLANEIYDSAIKKERYSETQKEQRSTGTGASREFSFGRRKASKILKTLTFNIQIRN